MDPQQAYNQWAQQYDESANKTRDLEGLAFRDQLEEITFTNVLEIGCGTGKNTAWLAERAQRITAVDLSENMITRAKEKLPDSHVNFVIADINEEWNFTSETFDLVSFSLMLEHIENLEAVFKKLVGLLLPGGYVYIGELHPFKQYTGSKARYETPEGTQVVTCYDHHISDFTNAARKFGLALVALDEYFDDAEEKGIPRILTLVFQRPLSAETI